MKVKKQIVWMMLALSIFALRYYTALPQFDHTYIGSYQDMYVEIRGKVREPPEESFSRTQISIELDAMKQFDQWFPIYGNVVAYAAFPGNIQYGDTISLRGELQKPFRNDPRIAAIVKNPKIKLITSSQGNFFFRSLFKLKQFFMKRLEELLPEPSGSFAAGILLGARGSIPRDVIDDFRKSGLTHIIALSGFNIVILIEFITRLLAILPRKLRNLFAIALVILFTILVGASASVVRAAIMGSLSLIAELFGRKSEGLRTLFITGFVMILIDPFIAIHDIGFQLSFGATAGILMFAKKWQKRFENIPNWFGSLDSLITTTAAQIFTLPLILFYFRGFSIIAPLANIFVLPFIPFLMLGSFLTLIVGRILAAPTWILFKLVLFIIHSFAALPFAFIDFGSS